MKLFTSFQGILKVYEAATSGTTVPPQPPISSIPNHIPSQLFSQTSNNISDSSSSGSTTSKSDSNINLPTTTVAVASEADNEVIEKMLKKNKNDILTTGEEMNVDNKIVPITKCSHNRRVHFPPDEKGVVTFVHNPIVSPFLNNDFLNCNPKILYEKYKNTCKSMGLEPLSYIVKQIESFYPGIGKKQDCLSFDKREISAQHLDAIEEILKATSFVVIDLEYCFIDDNVAEILGELIKFYNPVERLNLSFNNKISSNGWYSICSAIPYCDELNYLNLRYTSITNDNSFSMFAWAMKMSQSITCLHLENVNLTGLYIKELVHALTYNNVLKELYLGDNNLNSKDGEALYTLISRNDTIELLDLRNNLLCDEGLKYIGDALKTSWAIHHSQLCGLVVWNNKITGQSMTYLAGALNGYGKLETLNIGCNDIRDAGIFDLKPALQNPLCSIKRLGLQDTKLDNQSVIFLAECLTVNKNLVRLDIRSNPKLSLAGFIALHSAMKTNTTITVLNIDKSCSVANSEKVQELQDTFDECFKELEKCCDRNRRLLLDKEKIPLNNELNSETDDNEDEDGWISYDNINLDDKKHNYVFHDKVQKSEFNNNDTLTLGESLKLLMSGNVPSKIFNKQSSNEENLKDSGFSDMPTSLATIFRPPGLVHAESDCSVNVMRKRHNSSGAVNRVGRSSTKKRNVLKVIRSSSLTCEEHISDIKERVIKMEGSLHDINKSAQESKIDKSEHDNPTVVKEVIHSGLSHNLSASLPSLNIPPPKQKVPVKRIRRFSVSPASSFTNLAPCTKDNVVGNQNKESNKQISIQTKNRFMVQSVPNLSTLDEDCEKKCFQNNSAPVTPERKLYDDMTTIKSTCPFETIKEEDKKIVTDVVNDLVTFCVYDTTKKEQKIDTVNKNIICHKVNSQLKETELERETNVVEVVDILVNTVVELDRAETKKTTARSRLTINSISSHPIYSLVRLSSK
ncbi:Protein phosphatase 1 regulatory subunit 37 [Strongyloides ratti]|uniref:Protein phosphatase 1 regulatory subunit 37 n=1 Tax=Strongyloides ratti TaxID=34506 RepID=A0A090LNT4_STRRB|nr:Protein phosphatase 1 regulatory subunit 37 [Strongyloides ratti]CEF69844.1 Protein phosphatase 1 regulatory subunit 37 [Strongyloides ratti]